MSNTYFQFKQFRINQERCAMKVGTDGVLLGAWASMGAAAATSSPGPLRQAVPDLPPQDVVQVASVPEATRFLSPQDVAPDLPPLHFLDIGTGTGLLALMLAQRAASREWGRRMFSVTAVEREAAAATQARENVSASPWASAVTVVTADICTWRPAVGGLSAAVYDLIVCNPPFFSEALKCPDAARNAARHDDSLKPDDLFRLAAAWLKPAPAAFNLILPADREASAIEVAARYGLSLARVCRVYTAPHAASPGRVLLSFVRNVGTRPVSVPAGTAPLSPPAGLSVETLRLYAPVAPVETVGAFAAQSGFPSLATTTSASSVSAVSASPRLQYTAEYRALVQPFYLDN